MFTTGVASTASQLSFSRSRLRMNLDSGTETLDLCH